MLRRLTLVLLGLAVLPACSGEAETPGATLPPVTASPTPTAELVVPDAAKAGTADGAGAFAEFFFQTLNDAYRTRDASDLRELSHPACPPCEAFIEQVEGLEASNQTVESGDYLVTTTAAPPPELGEVIVDLTLDRADVRVVDAGGAVVDSGPAIQDELAQLRLIRTDDGWLARGYRLVES